MCKFLLYCTALHCTALHCTALHCTALHCTALHCTALHCPALPCTALHHIALHCAELVKLRTALPYPPRPTPSHHISPTPTHAPLSHLEWFLEPLVRSLGNEADNVSFLLQLTDKISGEYVDSMDINSDNLRILAKTGKTER